MHEKYHQNNVNLPTAMILSARAAQAGVTQISHTRTTSRTNSISKEGSTKKIQALKIGKTSSLMSVSASVQNS